MMPTCFLKRFVLSIIAFISIIFSSKAQLNLPRASQKAEVVQIVGISEISIEYSRPSVNGREIWGALVPYGMNDLGFGTAKESPWRAGANENTTINFTHDVLVEGEKLPAGIYGLHMVVYENGRVTLIFSENHTAWGSYFYDPAEDVLRVDVQSVETAFTEQLTYGFENVGNDSATAYLSWEKKKIPFRIEFDVTRLVMDDIRRKLQNQEGFNRQTWEQAAAFTLNNDGDLEEALEWINAAISGQFFSQQDFNNTNIKAGILMKLGRSDDAAKTLEGYLPKATIIETHQIGRQLIGMDLKEKALEVFKLNAKTHPDTWPVHYGLARGYSALGDYKTALAHLKKAYENAPNPASKGRVEANIKKLERGEDIN